MDPGYHQIEVDTWRPRSSIDTEIHSFFLGGSVRIQRLEELVATSYINANGESDVVNRFGLETEEGGKIKLNINICTQDIETRKKQRYQYNILKEKEKLETRKLVLDYTKLLQQQKAKQKNMELMSKTRNKGDENKKYQGDKESEYDAGGKVIDYGGMAQFN